MAGFVQWKNSAHTIVDSNLKAHHYATADRTPRFASHKFPQSQQRFERVLNRHTAPRNWTSARQALLSTKPQIAVPEKNETGEANDESRTQKAGGQEEFQFVQARDTENEASPL